MDAMLRRGVMKKNSKLAKLFIAPPGETEAEKRIRDRKRARALKNRESAYRSRGRALCCRSR